jgi:hypothetical protein
MIFNDEIIKVLKTPITKRSNRPGLLDYPAELRGPPNNKYGGHQALNLRGLKNNTFGPAGPVKRYTPEEIQEYEQSIKVGKISSAKSDKYV